MKNIREFAAMLYNFTYIPICCFSGQGLEFSLPANGADYLLPKEYIQHFLVKNLPLSYSVTDFGSIYGFARLKDSEQYFILGPISSIPYSKKEFTHMHSIFGVSETSYHDFDDFFQKLPSKSLEDFLNYLSYFYYALNETALLPLDIQNTDSSHSVSAQFVSLEYHDKEQNVSNNSYYIEKRLLSYVEKGDLNGLSQFSVTTEINGGIIADTMLRQLKNIFIVLITLVSRAAIQGGLSTSIAFHLSDSYILQAEGTNSAGALNHLISQMLYDYTKRVSEANIFLSSDPVLYRAIQFVRENTNRHISVSDVAEHVGLSKNYLSSYFKKTIGFELNAFIRRCKLEESKELLRYTDKTLSEISSYLCFSSQSHFQTLFKKQYGITPHQYRRQGT